MDRIILLVEDDWLLSQSLRTAFAAEGCAVFASSSGEYALALLEAHPSIEMLVTDIELVTALTGWEVAEAVRRVRPTLPVLYTSGSKPMTGRFVTGSRFITKPCSNDDVLQVCAEMLPAR